MNLKNKFFINTLIVLFAIPSVYANKTNHMQTIYLGSGCFWGAEKGYEAMEGVINAESGYANGYGVKPNYRSIIQFKNKYNENNFAEVVKVTFNSNAISLDEILKHYFENHDPTQLNRQGNDVGPMYRSVIFYHNEEQKAIAEESLTKTDASGLWNDRIVTNIEPLINYYVAENYHQNYFENNPNAGYCSFVIAPKIKKFKKDFAHLLKSNPAF